MSIQKWVLAAVIWLLLMLAMQPRVAWAVKGNADNWCTTSGLGALPGTTDQGSIAMPRDIPVGAVVPGTHFNLHITVTCKPGAFNTTTNVVNMAMSLWSSSATLTAVPGMTNVYTQSDSIKGVGFRILNAAGQAMALGPIINDGCTYSTAFLIGTGTNASTTFTFDGAFELVKVGAEVGMGSQTVYFFPAACGQAWGNNNSGSSDWRMKAQVSNPALTTCTVLNAVTQVRMPPIFASSMAGVGVVAAATPFHIDLQCSKGAMLYMTLTDNVTPANMSDKLTPTADSTATGVAFQLTRADDTVVSYGPDTSAAGATHQFQVGATMDGATQIPFAARYIRTGVVTPGSLQGRATFTLSYQ